MAMSSCGTYEGAGNLFWVNLKWSATPKVPVNEKGVDNFRQQHFSSPKRWIKQPMIIAVEESMTLHFGNLTRVTPEEADHALLLAVSGAIDAGEDEQVLRQWRAVLLTVPMIFEILPTNDQKFFRVNLRNEIITDFDSLARNTAQRIYELMSFKHTKETTMKRKLEVPELYTMWSEQVTESKAKIAELEKVTESFCRDAVTIYERLLNVPELRARCLALDSAYGKASPLNSSTNMKELVKIGKTPVLIEWMICTMHDLLETDQCTWRDFGTRALATNKGKKGLYELWVLKYELKQHLLGKFLDLLKLPGKESEYLRDALLSHDQFREKTRDRSWQGTLSETGRLLFNLVQALVYQQQHDGSLRTSLKAWMKSRAQKDHGKPLEQKEAEGPTSSSALAAGGSSVSLSELLGEKWADVSAEDSTSLEDWREYVAQMTEQFVTFTIDDNSLRTSEFGDKLTSTVLPKVDGPVLAIYDVKTSGESSSNPNVRQPPLRANHLKRSLQAFAQCRQKPGEEGELREGDFFFIFDGGKSGNEMAINNAFLKMDGSHMEKQKTTYTLLTDEESLKDRRERTRGFVQQDERIYVMSRLPLNMPKVTRKFFPGSNYGSCLGPVKAPAYLDPCCWRLTLEEKGQLYGRDGKILVGGPCEEPSPKPPSEDSREPVSWHFMNPKIFGELLHSFKPKAVVKFTDIDHNCAIECLKARVPLVSCCFTAAHASLLKKKVICELWKALCDESIPELYDVGLPFEFGLGHALNF
ncbi:Uncharacterized protein SCF082_LOCUS22815 [Durusdinium trenchii]|uniref:Uncharacterized protein n=1 Tax=Durusdinium trenchii TaxID=1381693 RepID=A0ABP0LJG1_9DINO